MKSIFKRSLALVLALLMVLAVCACGKDGGGGSKGEIKPLNDEEAAIIKNLGSDGLNGYEFTVIDFDSGRWNKDQSGSPYADAWVQILDEVEALYNCKITRMESMAPGDMFNVIQPEVAAGGKYADLVVTTQWAYGYFLGGDIMMDLNKLNVNWDNPWWNQNVRQMATFGGATKVGGGSFIFDTAQTWMLYYNDTVWKQCGFEDPYKLIEEGRWTQDKFAEYCLKAKKDMDGSGVVDSADDRWGLIAADGDFCRAWYMGLGGKYFTTDENGHVVLACNNERTYSIIEKMSKMKKQDKSISTYKYADEASKITDFINGKALFYAYMPGIKGLRDMEDDWGVMPLPKYDENQTEYMSGVDHNAAVFGVTNANTDIENVSVVLEALGRHAQILENIYWPDYEATYWRHPEDANIIADYVVGHGQRDLALIMQNAKKEIFNVPMGRVFSTVYGTASDFASWIDSQEDAITTKMEDYFQY